MSKLGSFKKISTNRDELGFQQELIDSAKITGGYGRKVTNPMSKGVADLLIQLRGFSMVQLECKDLGHMSRDFDVLSGITAQQEAHICELNRAAGWRVAFYCTRYVVEGREFAVFHDYTKRISRANIRAGLGYVIEKEGKYWPSLTAPWGYMGVPHLGASPTAR